MSTYKVRGFEFFFLFGLALLAAQGVASSGAGNGGDSVDRLLGGARSALRETVQQMRFDGNDGCQCLAKEPSSVFCKTLASLDEPRRKTCQKFLRGTLAQLARFAQEEGGVPFVVSAKPLTVETAAGPRRVLAMTDLGPKGPVSFDAQRLRELGLPEALALLTHEFSHKTLLREHGRYVRDDEAVGAFTGVGGGRRLLDALGSAVAAQAQRRGIVARASGLRDYYRCRIEEVGSVFAFDARGSSPRSQNLSGYRTGVGALPQDFRCSLRDFEDRHEVGLVVQIQEPGDCGEEREGRETSLAVWRMNRHTGASGTVATESKLLGARVLRGLNPLCQAGDVLEMEADVDGRRFRFRIDYEETLPGRAGKGS